MGWFPPTLAYYHTATITAVKSFIAEAPWLTRLDEVNGKNNHDGVKLYFHLAAGFLPSGGKYMLGFLWNLS